MIEGLRVLLVEDEFPVLLLLEDMTKDLGCVVVATCCRVDEAMRAAAETKLDAAILDVNLAGVRVFPVAAALKERGVPFLFASGYGRAGLEAPWQNHPMIQKPFSVDQLAAALEQAVRPRSN